VLRSDDADAAGAALTAQAEADLERIDIDI
jgi:hypothetical protein